MTVIRGKQLSEVHNMSGEEISCRSVVLSLRKTTSKTNWSQNLRHKLFFIVLWKFQLADTWGLLMSEQDLGRMKENVFFFFFLSFFP